MVLPSRTFAAVGVVGINFKCQLAGRAILTKSGTAVAECFILTWNAVAQRIMIIDITSIIGNKCVGGTCFALEVIQLFILIAATTANDAWFCVGNVFVTQGVANFAIVGGNMFRDVRCFVEQELARGASFAGCGRGVTGVLELAGVANGTECGAIDVFTAKGTKFAIVWRVVLRNVGCLVEQELANWTKFTSR